MQVIKLSKDYKYNLEIYPKNDRQEWLNNRGFGGSSVSALLGMNKWQTTLDIYCSSVNPTIHKEDSTNPSTIYGTKAEPIMAQLFALNYIQYEVEYHIDEIVMARVKDKPYETYTFDGLIVERETKRKGFLEIKTHEIQDSEDEAMWASGQLPEQYYIQLLQGFVVMNDKEFCELYAILNHKDYETNTIKWSELRHYHLERKDVIDDIELVEKTEIDFQENHIDKRIPPNIHIEL